MIAPFQSPSADRTSAFTWSRSNDCFADPESSGSTRAWAHASRFSHTPASGLCLPQSARDSVQLIVKCTTLGALLFAWQHDVGYLYRWRLTRQCKHLVHSDPGPDCSIAQARFADRFLHALRSEFSHVSEHYRKLLFPFGYVLSFTFSDGTHGGSNGNRAESGSIE